jgi:phosphoribosylformimino-5-aminoimidazole carboxamide ribonucleotide (ProFAR) isomerase
MQAKRATQEECLFAHAAGRNVSARQWNISSIGLVYHEFRGLSSVHEIFTDVAPTPTCCAGPWTAWGIERVAVGIDARDGIVATHGWQQTSGVSALDLARRMKALGVTRVVYTDIGRDGTLAGVNAAACAALAQATGLAVIASGGVATLEDIRRVKAVEADGVEGVIVGKALYAGQVDLVQALEVAGKQKSPSPGG